MRKIASEVPSPHASIASQLSGALGKNLVPDFTSHRAPSRKGPADDRRRWAAPMESRHGYTSKDSFLVANIRLDAKLNRDGSGCGKRSKSGTEKSQYESTKATSLGVSLD